jgi:hypothetical protein
MINLKEIQELSSNKNYQRKYKTILEKIYRYNSKDNSFKITSDLIYSYNFDINSGKVLNTDCITYTSYKTDKIESTSIFCILVEELKTYEKLIRKEKLKEILWN